MRLKSLFIALFFMIFLLEFVSSLRINEIEINGVAGEEWVEIYNNENETLNLSNFEIWDGLSSPKKIYTFPNGTTINSGDYFIVNFSNKLNNDGDFVTLYNGTQKIDETPTTPPLKNLNKDDFTWNYCDGNWLFVNSTKNGPNNCNQQTQPPTNSSGNTTNQNQTNQNINSTNSTELSQAVDYQVYSIKSTPKNSNITFDTISLNSQSIKTSKNSGLDNKIKSYSVYYLITFAVLLLFLFLLRKKRKDKNEFDEIQR